MLPSRAEIVGKRPHWLLDLVVGGRTFRYADTTLDVSTSVGTVLRYQIADALGELRVTMRDGPLSVAIELEGATPDGEAWASIVEAGGGGTLTGATATLRRWFEGQALERARVIISGAVTSPEYGSADEPFDFTIERIGDEVSATIPPADAVMDETTWPVQSALTADPAQPDATVRGRFYPWIFGVPGYAADGLAWGVHPISAAASPAYVASHYQRESYILGQWVIAGHEVQATQVRISDMSGGYSHHDIPADVLAVTTATDLRGRTVSVVEVGDTWPLRMIPGNEYWVTWSDGGLLNETRTGTLRGAGEICEYMLRYVGERVDRGRMAATRTYLDRYYLDFALTEPTKPRTWIDQTLRAWLPLVWRESEDGVYLDLYRYDAKAADAIAHLVAVQDLETAASSGDVAVQRIGRLKWSDVRGVENDLTMRYAPMQQQEPLKVRRLGAPGVAGEPGVADPTVEGEVPSQMLAVSQSRFGVRPVVADCNVVCDDATADLMLATRARWRGTTRRSFSVSDASFLLDSLEPGSVVTYSESAVSLSRALALVMQLTLGLDTDEAEIELIDRVEAT